MLQIFLAASRLLVLVSIGPIRFSVNTLLVVPRAWRAATAVSLALLRLARCVEAAKRALSPCMSIRNCDLSSAQRLLGGAAPHALEENQIWKGMRRSVQLLHTRIVSAIPHSRPAREGDVVTATHAMDWRPISVNMMHIAPNNIHRF